MDLGCYLPDNNKENHISTKEEKKLNINLKKGIGFFNAGRYIQKESQQYWMLEYIQQLQLQSKNKPLKCIILGCVDYNRYQYSIYILELGYECKYTSEIGILKIGDIIWLNIDYVHPRLLQLRLSLAEKPSSSSS